MQTTEKKLYAPEEYLAFEDDTLSLSSLGISLSPRHIHEKTDLVC